MKNASLWQAGLWSLSCKGMGGTCQRAHVTLGHILPPHCRNKWWSGNSGSLFRDWEGDVFSSSSSSQIQTTFPASISQTISMWTWTTDIAGTGLSRPDSLAWTYSRAREQRRHLEVETPLWDAVGAMLLHHQIRSSDWAMRWSQNHAAIVYEHVCGSEKEGKHTVASLQKCCHSEYTLESLCRARNLK